jgi:hypothetical protein
MRPCDVCRGPEGCAFPTAVLSYCLPFVCVSVALHLPPEFGAILRRIIHACGSIHRMLLQIHTYARHCHRCQIPPCRTAPVRPCISRVSRVCSST